MKAYVLMGYIDKETKENRSNGDVITISKERFEEINKNGNFLKEVEENTEDVTEKKKRGIKKEA